MHNTLLLFGATGDLAQRYLFPSLLQLFTDGLLPQDFRIRALALSPHNTTQFRDILRPRLEQALPIANTAHIQALLQRVDYLSVDLNDPTSIAEAVRDLTEHPCISYLAIPPGLYTNTALGLAQGEGTADTTPIDAGKTDRTRLNKRTRNPKHHRHTD